jgi:hypothetical protein
VWRGGDGGDGGWAVSSGPGYAAGGTGGHGGYGGTYGGDGGAGGNATGINNGNGTVTSFPGRGGAGGISDGLSGNPGQNGVGSVSPTVSLYVDGHYTPWAYLSIAGGPVVSALVDTGSTGLLVPPQNVNFQTLGNPIQRGLSQTYAGGGTTYYYDLYSAQVNLGNGNVTTPINIGVMTSTTSGSLSDAFPIMGVGVDAGGPSTSPVTALPSLNQGVLINEPAHQMEFGPNPLPSYASVFGAPQATGTGNLQVQITAPGGTPGSLQQVSGAIIDSGTSGSGLVTSSLIDLPPGSDVPAGTIITVYGDGTELYWTQVEANNPASVTGGNFNTGNAPFVKHPIYIEYAPSLLVPIHLGGTTYFDNPSYT